MDIDVTVLEARERAGGRFANSQLLDYHFDPVPWLVPSESPALASLIALNELNNDVERQPLTRIQLRRNRHNRYRMLGREACAPAPYTARTRRLRTVIEDFGPLLDARQPERAARLDDRSVADFCRLYMGSGALEDLYGPLLEGGLGLDTEETSRLALLSLMNDFGDIKLSRITGIGRLIDELEQRVKLRFNTRVQTIADDGRHLRTDPGESLPAEAIVLATSARRASQLANRLTPAEQRFLEGIRYAPRIQIALAINQKHPATDNLLVAGQRAGLSGIWRAEADPDASLLLLSAHPRYAREVWQESNMNLCESLLGHAERAMPGLREAVDAMGVYRIPRASAEFRVGHYRSIERVRRDQRAHFARRRTLLCNDYLLAPHAEGAAQAGLRTAEELRNWL